MIVLKNGLAHGQTNNEKWILRLAVAFLVLVTASGLIALKRCSIHSRRSTAWHIKPVERDRSFDDASFWMFIAAIVSIFLIIYARCRTSKVVTGVFPANKNRGARSYWWALAIHDPLLSLSYLACRTAYFARREPAGCGTSKGLRHEAFLAEHLIESIDTVLALAG